MGTAGKLQRRWRMHVDTCISWNICLEGTSVKLQNPDNRHNLNTEHSKTVQQSRTDQDHSQIFWLVTMMYQKNVREKELLPTCVRTLGLIPRCYNTNVKNKQKSLLASTTCVSVNLSLWSITNPLFQVIIKWPRRISCCVHSMIFQNLYNI